MGTSERSRSLSSSIWMPGFVTSLVVALAALGAALVLALFVPGSPAVAGSTELDVNATADGADGACEQPVPISNPNADCTLREAIIEANTHTVDAINVPAGTYTLRITGRDEDAAATGDLDIRRGVTIRGEGARNTIINGNGIDRVFHMPVNPPNPFTLGLFSLKITGGVSDFGGGIFHDAQGATLFLGRSTVSGNQADNGGGILAQRGPLNVMESTISGNRAPGGQGGGIHFGGTANAGPYTLKNTTVNGNQSRFGGGITTYDPVTITDSTIAFNTAQQPGGGLHVGGGAGPYTLKNTIVSNNSSNFAGFNNCDRVEFVVSEGNNLEKGTSCGFDQPGDINADPKLGQLENNGGPTNTRALPRGSPAINAGGDPFPSTDQRGVARPQGFANDIGAFERRQDINVVQCPTGGASPDDCVGTSARDALIGRDGSFDHIQGGEGGDTYNGKGSCDALDDSSLTSSDRYVVTVVDFCNVGISSLSIQDDGGDSDVLDLSRFYASTDFVFEIGFTNLIMDGAGVNNIDVLNFFTPSGGPTDSIDTFKFSDKTLTAQQVRAIIQ
jgi:CSLREA domain-containing protein